MLKIILIDFFEEVRQSPENKSSKLNGDYKNNQFFSLN